MLLEINNIHVHYNKVAALKGISLEVPERGIVTIVGANGAGKTTILRTISGLRRPSDGEIWFNKERVDGMAPERIVGKGISHVLEGRHIFPDLTVEENLRTGAFLRDDAEEIETDLLAIFEHFPRLEERRTQWGKTLSGGEQQMLAIGRALMNRPKLLLLDEPSMGLSPKLVHQIADIIGDIAESGVPVVLVEQNAGLALELAQYAYVLETGNVALHGPADELHENDHVKRAYLGG